MRVKRATIPYQADITRALRFDGRKNKLKLITQSRQPSTRWYSGGGLYRDVCLWVGNPIHVKPWDIFVTTPKITENQALVQMEMELTGTEEEQEIQVECFILDEKGETVAQVEKNRKLCGKQKEIFQLTVDNPHLWDLDTPYLYTYRVVLKKKGEVQDVAEDTFGIRIIEVDAENGFRLNGRQMNLKGGCVHHDNGFLGACAYPKAEERKMKILKKAGYNTVRISHYPPSLALLKICDRMGMLLTKLAAKVREFDTTRFVTSALCCVFPEKDEEGSNFDMNLLKDNTVWNEVTKEFCEPLDIVGYNYLKDLYEESHELFPDRVMLGTETHSFTTYDFWQKVEKLSYVIGDCIWAAVDYMGEVGVGKVYWESEGADFSFMTPYPWRTSWQSDIDLTGEQRPQSVYREIMWGNTGKSGIFTTHPKHFGENFRGTDWHWYDVNDRWCFEDCWLGKLVKVDIYGAGDEAEFILNGESLGRRKIEKLMASMDISYTPGVLEGIVYREGKEISRCRLVTPGKAAKLELCPEDERIQADGKDLAYVRVILKDENGNRLTHDEREIQVDVTGEGTFLAVGSGNPCTEDHITAKECHLYRGTAIVILKSKEAGETTITVTADGVEAGSCVVRS